MSQSERSGRAAAARRIPTEDPRRFTIPEAELPPGFGLGSGTGDPAVPRPAATVVLLRDGAEGVEALLLRRHGRSGFAAGMWVFPGGRVDVSDRRLPVAGTWSGPSPEAWAERLGVGEPEEAVAYVASAVREAWEETGIALVDLPRGADPAALREALLGERRSLVDILAEGARLRSDRLAYIAHWITPEAEPRRFDTRFFLAISPSGAEADPHRAELTDAQWIRPSEAIGRFQRGELRLLPPTAETLRELAPFTSASDALETLRDRPVPTILPRMYRDEEGVVIEILPRGREAE